MQKPDTIRLQHMFDASREAISFIKNKNRKSLYADRKLVLALMKSIEIIGEAANKILKSKQDDMPEIPWVEIVGMRNRLIHAYFDINLDILWKTVIEDLPDLVKKLEIILTTENPTNSNSSIR